MSICTATELTYSGGFYRVKLSHTITKVVSISGAFHAQLAMGGGSTHPGIAGAVCPGNTSEFGVAGAAPEDTSAVDFAWTEVVHD